VAQASAISGEKRPSRLRIWTYWLMAAALVTVAIFAILEIALRVTLNRAFTAETNAPLVLSSIPGLGYQNAPNRSDPAIRTDSRGLRYRPPDPVPVRFTILLLGDSIAYGSGVAYEKTFAPLLESRLDQALGERTAVWNAAVPGYNTVQEAIMFESLGTQVRPDLVVVQFCMNDYLDPPRLTPGGTLDAIASEAQPGFSLTYLLYQSRAFVFLKEKLKDLEKLKPEWFPVWAHYIHRVTKKPGWQRAKDALERMQEDAAKMHARLLVVIFPVEQQLRIPDRTAQDDLLAYGRAHGIDMLDLYGPFHDQWRTGLYINIWAQARSVDKLHLNQRGHAYTAQLLASAIAARRKGDNARAAAGQ
jgi:lysophospholipase L1-like esterase